MDWWRIMTYKNEIYQHYKGGLYRFIMTAYLESKPELMAIYISLETGVAWVRPYSEFKTKFKKVKDNG